MIEGKITEMGELKEYEVLPPKTLYIAVYSLFEDLSYWSSINNTDKNDLIKCMQNSGSSKYYGVRIYSIPI
jgi:hypothetical protein